MSATYDLLNKLRTERSKMNELDDAHAVAKGYAEVVKPLMEECRIQVDQLEKLTEDIDATVAKGVKAQDIELYNTIYNLTEYQKSSYDEFTKSKKYMEEKLDQELESVNKLVRMQILAVRTANEMECT